MKAFTLQMRHEVKGWFGVLVCAVHDKAMRADVVELEEVQADSEV